MDKVIEQGSFNGYLTVSEMPRARHACTFTQLTAPRLSLKFRCTRLDGKLRRTLTLDKPYHAIEWHNKEVDHSTGAYHTYISALYC